MMPQSTLESLIFFLVLSLVATYVVNLKYKPKFKAQNLKADAFKWQFKWSYGQHAERERLQTVMTMALEFEIQSSGKFYHGLLSISERD